MYIASIAVSVGIGLGAVLPPDSAIMMFTGASIFAFLERRYHRAVGTFAWRLWVDSKEAVCAGLIAGWALLGIGDGVVGAFELFPANDAEADARAASTTTDAGGPATPAEREAERVIAAR